MQKKTKSLGQAVLSETIQHPATLFPAAGSILALFYMIATTPSVQAFAVILGCMGISAGSWIVNFFFRTDRFVEKIKGKWDKEKDKAHLEKIAKMAQALAAENLNEAVLSLSRITGLFNQFNEWIEQKLPSGAIIPEQFALNAMDMLENSLALFHHLIDLEKSIRLLANTPQTQTITQELERLYGHRKSIFDQLDTIEKTLSEAVIEGLPTLASESLGHLKASQTAQSSVDHFKASLESARRANEELRKLKL